MVEKINQSSLVVTLPRKKNTLEFLLSLTISCEVLESDLKHHAGNHKSHELQM